MYRGAGVMRYSVGRDGNHRRNVTFTDVFEFRRSRRRSIVILDISHHDVSPSPLVISQLRVLFFTHLFCLTDNGYRWPWSFQVSLCWVQDCVLSSCYTLFYLESLVRIPAFRLIQTLRAKSVPSDPQFSPEIAHNG